MNPHPPSQFAAEIIAKLKAYGIPEIKAGRVVPPGKTIALVSQAGGDVLIRLRHAPGEILLWFYAPARDTLIPIGETTDSVRCPHPFYIPMPPTAEIQLQPLWNALGITYYQASTTEIYQNPNNLTVISGVCKKAGHLRTSGIFLLVANKTLRRVRGIDGLISLAMGPTNKRYGTVYCARLNADFPASPAVMALPLVTQTLASGTWPLLVMDGQLDILLAAGGTWTLLPW